MFVIKERIYAHPVHYLWYINGNNFSSVIDFACKRSVVDFSWNVMAQGDAREGKWRGNWRMECVASTLHTTSEHCVSSITTADAHTSAASSRLNWRPRDLNGLVRFAERRHLVSARMPSHFNWPLTAALRPLFGVGGVINGRVILSPWDVFISAGLC